MAGEIYRIKDWEKHFECSSTRKIVGALKWVPVPCKHDGATFRRLMKRNDAVVILGCWMLILQVAAKCAKRGVLAGDHGPIGPDELALMTDGPAAHFATALSVLSSPEIGWLIKSAAIRHDPPPSATIAADSGAVAPASARIAVYRKEGIQEYNKEENNHLTSNSLQANGEQTLEGIVAAIASTKQKDTGRTFDDLMASKKGDQ